MEAHTLEKSLPADQTLVWGGFCLLVFLYAWLLSLLLPVATAVLAWLECYRLVVAIWSVCAIAYLPYIGRIAAFKSLLGRGARSYFRRTSISYEGPLPSPHDPALLCIHPHGIFCFGWSQMFASPNLDHVHFCFSSVLYGSPLFRLLARLLGRPQACDKGTITTLMKKKKSLALIPGGFEEATIHCRGKDRVYIKSRKGFVKYALQYGYSLRPVYCFGEHATHSNLQGAWSTRHWLNSLGLPAILPWGALLCPLLPRRGTEIHSVVGPPLHLPVIAQPTAEEVALHHQRYVDSLVALFDRNCAAFGAKKLEVW